MANPDTPHGLSFAYTLHGGPPHMRKFTGDTAQGIYVGDILYAAWNSSLIATKTTGDAVDTEQYIGVAASYSASGAATDFWVYDDLANTVFTVQVDSSGITFDSSFAMSRYGTTWGQGSTITGQSRLELDVASTGINLLRIIGLVDAPNNSTAGAHQEVYVQLVHTDIAGGGGNWIVGAATTQ